MVVCLLSTFSLTVRLCSQVQEKSQLRAWIKKLEAQQLEATGVDSSEPLPSPVPATSTTMEPDAMTTPAGSAADVEIRKAQANLRELQERHALQVSVYCTHSSSASVLLTESHARVCHRHS